MRGATPIYSLLFVRLAISIHAPHARSDTAAWPLRRPTVYFNPRSSCEERLPCRFHAMPTFQFQSTLLMRGATRVSVITRSNSLFQSTLLMRGATSNLECCDFLAKFQSTLLMRGATTRRHVIGMPYCAFQSTLLMRGATAPKSYSLVTQATIFQSTLLMRGAT